MFLLFGSRSRTRQLGRLPHACSRCRRHAWHAYARSTRWFTFFFIPCIPLGSSTVAQCTACGARQSVARAQADAMLRQCAMLQAPAAPRG